MNNLAQKLPRAVRHSYFPVILILIANLIVGLFTFQNYGLSWDEPLFYQYADAVPYAYSISARTSGDFNLEKAYGPSAEDHKIYGPIYLLLARPLVSLLDQVFPVAREDAWHLVNFITFQVGVLFFFALCLRWMSSWAAFGAAALFSTQPVLWGHSFINPKDIPFTVFFIAALYFGFKMVDGLSDPALEPALPTNDTPASTVKPRRGWKNLQVLAIVFTTLALVILVFSAPLRGLVSQLIQSAYAAPPDSLFGRLFGALAANAPSIPVEAYINKGLILFSRIQVLLVALCLVFLIPAGLYTFWPKAVARWIATLATRLSPLPTCPTWGWKKLASPSALGKILVAGILLGLVVSIRVVGPLVGVLVGLYFLFKHERHSLAGFLVYLVIAFFAMYAAWPYLWGAPLAHFMDVVRHMANNPQILPVLFNGIVYPSNKLPVSYLPVMLGITLTWPVWLIFIAGTALLVVKFWRKCIDWRSLSPILLWFLVPFIYVILVRPPMYDGYRHFLFILPPVFILGGFAFQSMLERLRNRWSYALLLIVLIAPGVLGLVRLHPYEYTYYNQLVGGTRGAFRRFETDFWLTCYKELMAQVDENVVSDTTLFVYRQPPIAQKYAPPSLIIERFDPDDDQTFPGSLLLLTTRANVDLSIHPEGHEVLSVGKEGATFCLVKDIP